MPCDSGVPQGSVFSPLLFTAYVAPVSELLDSFGVSHHHFADYCISSLPWKLAIIRLLSSD